MRVTLVLLLSFLLLSCVVARVQAQEQADEYEDVEYEVMAADEGVAEVEVEADENEFEVSGGEQLQFRAQPQQLAKQSYTAPARMEELPAITNNPIYLPAQMNKQYSTQKQMRTKTYQVPSTQTVLIRQPIIRTQRYKQPVIQPVVTQPVVTTRIVTQPVKQPVLTTKTVTQPMIYTQPIIVRRLSSKYQTNGALHRTEYATNPTITQQTQMLAANPTENTPQYFNLPAQVQEEGGKQHSPIEYQQQLPQLQQAEEQQEQQLQQPQQQQLGEGMQLPQAQQLGGAMLRGGARLTTPRTAFAARRGRL